MYGIFSYIYHQNQLNVGKYTSPMDPMGHLLRDYFISRCLYGSGHSPIYYPGYISGLHISHEIWIPSYTLPETNVSPENWWLGDYILSFWGPAYFQGQTVSFTKGNMNQSVFFKNGSMSAIRGEATLVRLQLDQPPLLGCPRKLVNG